MAAHKFECPHCGQHLEADHDQLAGNIECPTCKGTIDGSAQLQSSRQDEPLSGPGPDVSRTKKCPFCAEEILADAVKCKHCGELLAGGVLRFGADGRMRLGRSQTPALPKVDFRELPPGVRRGVRYRVMMFGHAPVMPQLCAVTGETATMESTIPRFLWGRLAGSPYLFVWQFHRQTISLPFSPKGLAAYQQKRPFFSLVLEGGLLVARYVPLLPLDIMWLVTCFGAVWPLALFDKAGGKRNLCRAHWKKRIVVPEEEFDISVTSRDFVDVFLQLNPAAFEPEKGFVYRLGFCQKCNAELPIRKKRCKHPLHAVLTVLTYYLWAIVWLVLAHSGRWSCTRCKSSRVRRVKPQE